MPGAADQAGASGDSAKQVEGQWSQGLYDSVLYSAYMLHVYKPRETWEIASRANICRFVISQDWCHPIVKEFADSGDLNEIYEQSFSDWCDFELTRQQAVTMSQKLAEMKKGTQDEGLIALGGATEKSFRRFMGCAAEHEM